MLRKTYNYKLANTRLYQPLKGLLKKNTLKKKHLYLYPFTW